MDDVYVNVSDLPGNRRIQKMDAKSSQNICTNYEDIHTLEPNRIGPASQFTGTKFVKKSSCTAVVILLGLVCLLLLIGFITLVFLSSRDKSQQEMETMMFQKLNENLTRDRKELETSYSVLKGERDQLQTSYSVLKGERDQLQTSYSVLKGERDQLQTSYNSMVEDQLQKRIEDMTKNSDDLQRKSVGCLQEWVYFSGSLYYISSNMKSWQESRNDCLQRGADLVIINSKEEQEFTRHFKKLMWIGLTDREQEGTWKWVDGSLLDTSYWDFLEPNGVPGRDEDCVEIKKHLFVNTWNDESCDLQRFWICEKKLVH